MSLYYRLKNYLWDKFVTWLTYEPPHFQTPLTSFERLRYELRPGDVLLVEGRSNVAEIIKSITQSMWTHSVIYIGRLHDIDDPMLRDQVQKYRHCSPDEQLIIEAILGKGIIVSPIEVYEKEHLRICRPRGITRADSQAVIEYAIMQLGVDYNVRQIMDLARFMFPYSFLPKRWRSTLFEHNAGRPTKTVCSTMMAEAFAKVRFPIVPVIHQEKNGNLSLIRRNSKLITPRDFDHSPYFDVIKYPVLDFDELGIYRKLPWDQTSVHCSTISDCFVSDPEMIESLSPDNLANKHIPKDTAIRQLDSQNTNDDTNDEISINAESHQTTRDVTVLPDDVTAERRTADRRQSSSNKTDKEPVRQEQKYQRSKMDKADKVIYSESSEHKKQSSRH